MDEKKKYISEMQRAENIKLIITYTTFAIAFAMCMYIGVKTVVFKTYTKEDPNHPDVEPVKTGIGYLLGVGIIFINLEFFLLRDYVDSLTKEPGVFVKGLHPHPLYFEIDLVLHGCDLCQERLKKPYYEAYRCRTCDFDMCSRCFKRKDNKDFKGM